MIKADEIGSLYEQIYGLLWGGNMDKTLIHRDLALDASENIKMILKNNMA